MSEGLGVEFLGFRGEAMSSSTTRWKNKAVSAFRAVKRLKPPNFAPKVGYTPCLKYEYLSGKVECRNGPFAISFDACQRTKGVRWSLAWLPRHSFNGSQRSAWQSGQCGPFKGDFEPQTVRWADATKWPFAVLRARQYTSGQLQPHT